MVPTLTWTLVNMTISLSSQDEATKVATGIHREARKQQKTARKSPSGDSRRRGLGELRFSTGLARILRHAVERPRRRRRCRRRDAARTRERGERREHW